MARTSGKRKTVDEIMGGKLIEGSTEKADKTAADMAEPSNREQNEKQGVHLSGDYGLNVKFSASSNEILKETKKEIKTESETEVSAEMISDAFYDELKKELETEYGQYVRYFSSPQEAAYFKRKVTEYAKNIVNHMKDFEKREVKGIVGNSSSK